MWQQEAREISPGSLESHLETKSQKLNFLKCTQGQSDTGAAVWDQSILFQLGVDLSRGHIREKQRAYLCLPPGACVLSSPPLDSAKEARARTSGGADQ